MSRDVKILAVIAIVVIAGAIFGANYYQSSVQKDQKAVNAGNTTKAPAGELIRPDSPSLGPADAKVTIVEFYDPECEACAAFHPFVKRILTEQEGKIRLVTRYMPLHPNSMKAASFTEAAGEQGKYWEAQELLFKKQPEWGTRHGAPPDPSAPPIDQLFNKYARELGLDLEKASKAMSEKRFDEKIERDKKDGQSLGARKTPTIFVNGRMLTNFGEPGLRSLIAEEMAK